MKRKIILEIEQLRERLESALSCRKKINREMAKINVEILKLKKLVHSRNDWPADEFKGLEKDAERLTIRNIELKELYQTVKKDIKSMEERLSGLYSSLLEISGSEIYPYEILKMLEKQSELKWDIQWIISSEGSKIGYAFVNEKDEAYGKRMVADYSIADLSVDVENSNNRKVVYASMKFDPEAVIESWDWMDFYLYATAGLWKNKELKDIYDSFLERDIDFAEYLCFAIREELMKTDEEILDEIAGKQN